ncbi:MAG: 2-C-methyl-D-erythritol 4-phosphate cytidylyltransferase [Acidobacteriota bacterium]
MRATAIIVAAGRGERLGGALQKQFRPCAGRPLLAHALEQFCRARALVEEIILVLPRAQDLEVHLGGSSAWPARVRAIGGGEDRQASVAAGLAAAPAADLVVVHDGVRPLVTARLIQDVCREARRSGAAVAAGPCVDTVKEVRDGRVHATLERDHLRLVQTPQAFQGDLLRRAHLQARRDGFRSTDDSALVERLGVKVAVVETAVPNLKVTGPDDWLVAEGLLAARRAVPLQGGTGQRE